MMVTHVSLQLSPQLKPDSPQSSHFLGWAYSACPVPPHSSCSNDPSSVPTGQPLSSPSPPILTPSHAYFSCPFPLSSMTLPLTGPSPTQSLATWYLSSASRKVTFITSNHWTTSPVPGVFIITPLCLTLPNCHCWRHGERRRWICQTWQLAYQ